MKKQLLFVCSLILILSIKAGEIIKRVSNDIETTYKHEKQEFCIGYPYNKMYTFKASAPQETTQIEYVWIEIDYFPFQSSHVSTLPDELQNELTIFKNLYFNNRQEENDAQQR